MNDDKVGLTGIQKAKKQGCEGAAAGPRPKHNIGSSRDADYEVPRARRGASARDVFMRARAFRALRGARLPR